MSVNKLISVNNVVINLLDDLALDHTKYTPMFTRWALWAEKQIGSYYSYIKKHKVLTIKGCTAELPDDCANLQIAIMGDLGDCCQDIFDSTCLGISTGTFSVSDPISSFLIVDLGDAGDTVATFGQVQYVIQDNKIVFLNNYDGQKVTIQYLGVKSDCDDMPYVNENNIEALGEYCMYKFKSRNIRSGIDIGVVDRHKNNWHRLAASAKADSANPSFAEKQMVINLNNDPYAGRGLWVGQYSTNGGTF